MGMDDEREPGQSIAIASVPNLRDLGGWPMLEEFTVDQWAPNLLVWGYLAARR